MFQIPSFSLSHRRMVPEKCKGDNNKNNSVEDLGGRSASEGQESSPPALPNLAQCCFV